MGRSWLNEGLSLLPLPLEIDMSKTTVEMYEDLMANSTASDWLKLSFKTALCRDPVDAANDAETLVSMLAEVADTVAQVNAAIGQILPGPTPGSHYD